MRSLHSITRLHHLNFYSFGGELKAAALLNRHTPPYSASKGGDEEPWMWLLKNWDEGYIERRDGRTLDGITKKSRVKFTW